MGGARVRRPALPLGRRHRRRRADGRRGARDAARAPPGRLRRRRRDAAHAARACSTTTARPRTRLRRDATGLSAAEGPCPRAPRERALLRRRRLRPPRAGRGAPLPAAAAGPSLVEFGQARVPACASQHRFFDLRRAGSCRCSRTRSATSRSGTTTRASTRCSTRARTCSSTSARWSASTGALRSAPPRSSSRRTPTRRRAPTRTSRGDVEEVVQRHRAPRGARRRGRGDAPSLGRAARHSRRAPFRGPRNS